MGYAAKKMRKRVLIARWKKGGYYDKRIALHILVQLRPADGFRRFRHWQPLFFQKFRISTNIRSPMAFKIFSNLETSNSSSREAQFGRNRFQKEQRSVCVTLGYPSRSTRTTQG